MRVHRNATPEQQGHASLGAALLKDATRILNAALILREEEHGHAVIALSGQDLTALLRLFAEKMMRHLEEDAGAVAGVLLQARAATVLQINEYRKSIIQNLMALLSMKISERANAARVVFKLRTIQSLMVLVSGFSLLLHRLPPR